MKTIIIVGSARKDGNTGKAATQVSELLGVELLHLIDYNISPYDYQNRNLKDDFFPLIKKIIADYDTMILATPVYWYSMSAQMKTFIDRFSDLISIEKDLGRKLRGKNMAVISSSAGDNLGENFWLPFKATARYLGINYLGDLHTYGGKDASQELREFTANIRKSLA